MKMVIKAGLLGGVAAIVWMFVVNGLFGFRHNMDMKRIPNERQVYQVLKENIMEPGRYVCNPEVTPAGFPGGEPVYGILYGGMGHEAAGLLELGNLVLMFLVCFLAAWMLTLSSPRVLSSYRRKVLFFSLIGLLVALFYDLNNFGIGNYPLRDALFLAIHTILLWTFIGVVMSLQIKLEPAT